MDFMMKLLKNLGFLVLIGIALFVLFPEQMSGIFNLYGAVFGPLAIIFLIGAALPKKSKS
jgi:cytochrome bd-type quinol oxidase subunit 2